MQEMKLCVKLKLPTGGSVSMCSARTDNSQSQVSVGVCLLAVSVFTYAADILLKLI